MLHTASKINLETSTQWDALPQNSLMSAMADRQGEMDKGNESLMSSLRNDFVS